MLPLPSQRTLHILSLLSLFFLASPTLLFSDSSVFVSAAFTVPIKNGNDSSIIEQNTAGTWCYYPAPRAERTLFPKLDCDPDLPSSADLRHVLATHLHSSTNAISYYSASLQRLGGAEYVVAGNPGKVYLCVSGRATDGLYETSCEVSTRDNEFGVGRFGNRTVCSVEVGQDSVSDACYAAGIKSAAARLRGDSFIPLGTLAVLLAAIW